jgi:hypothetical protein
MSVGTVFLKLMNFTLLFSAGYFEATRGEDGPELIRYDGRFGHSAAGFEKLSENKTTFRTLFSKKVLRCSMETDFYQVLLKPP